ncbi:hypothetical protein F1C16_03190 [Hymenobacter sp. NBH84]|uniref:hypothetical protein n=1 Tax=Hymenobacter sp. NBH84 TaxID=2596915 RepID=UPI00162675AB|nr:hypothetical protein [Hymenobacter sp. NBH84]QNE38626.1 hypothetical protein F1C16_03190 [Hymenobacter sp. NBH84]
MKYFSTYLVVTFLAGILTACEKNSIEPLPEESLSEFYVHAQQNGKNWLERGSAAYHKTQQIFSISAGTPSSTEKYTSLYLQFSMPKERFDALVKSTPAQIQNPEALWLQTENEDIVTDSFRSDSLNVPTIEIIRIDTVEKVVEGRFQATLQRDSHFTKKVELKRFEKGTFRVRYKEFTI